MAGGADAVAHLPRRPLGEGDRRQLVRAAAAVAAVLVRLQAREEPLGQHEGLAAAGPGRQGHGNAPRGDRPLLLLGQSLLLGGCHVFSKERTWLMRQTAAYGQRPVQSASALETGNWPSRMPRTSPATVLGICARSFSHASTGSRLPSAAWYIFSACLGSKAVVGQVPVAGLPRDAIAVAQDDFDHGHGVQGQLQGQPRARPPRR